MKPDFYNKTLDILADLKKSYPSYSLAKHIDTALSDYPEIWSLSDKEVHYAFTKYRASMEMDVPHEQDEREIDRIIRDGMNLSSILDEDEEEEY